MRLLICGSAAAEAVPGLFCTCPLCLKALKDGGKDIRSRTAYQLGEKIRIDFGPDTFYHMVKFGLRLDLLTDLIFTHSHRDHFNPGELENRRRGMSRVPEDSLLRIIGDTPLIDRLEKEIDAEKSKLTLARVAHGSRLILADGVELTALRAEHGTPDALIYAFRTPEWSCFIANDTGWFPGETWDLLKKFRFDAVILDCCYQNIDHRTRHMGGESFLALLGELRKMGSLSEKARLVANHFSHNPGMSHEDLCRWLDPCGVETGFDGMVLEL